MGQEDRVEICSLKVLSLLPPLAALTVPVVKIMLSLPGRGHRWTRWEACVSAPGSASQVLLHERCRARQLMYPTCSS